MVSAKLTSKGQITIPANIRAALGVEAGSRLEFVETGKVSSPSSQRPKKCSRSTAC